MHTDGWLLRAATRRPDTTALVTDDSADPMAIAALRDRGVEVHVA